MILLLLAAEAAMPSRSPSEERFEACIALTDTDPAKALDEANAWKIGGGGILARQCEGIAYSALRRWIPAATAFEQAARAAEREKDGRAPRLWVQAGNAALAAGDYTKSRSHLDAALATGTLKDAEAGEAHLDRARAAVALNDNGAARSDLDAALKLVPADPLAWLLSATLARRGGDLERARNDIAEAAKLAPDEASVALEAGNIAIVSGADSAARTAWEAAVKASPDSSAGKAAANSLKQLGTR
jgi:tetratricopeptide (TPR) repeat protein